MTNFDCFANVREFSSFVEPAVAAERIYRIDAAASVMNCRRAMEAAIKWMYSVDGALVMPYQDTLACLMNTDEFRQIVDVDLYRRMDFIRKVGNSAAHGGRTISKEQAALCLENLFIFLDFVAYCYSENYEEREFDASLLEKKPASTVILNQERQKVREATLALEESEKKRKELEAAVANAERERSKKEEAVAAALAESERRQRELAAAVAFAEKERTKQERESVAANAEMERRLADMMRENASLREELTAKQEELAARREELTARRREQQATYVPKPLDLSEYETRKLYIDAMLEDAGWVRGKDWLEEYAVMGMPNPSGTGSVDYALLGDDGRVLAVVEAKRTCADVVRGRQQAKLYADAIEQKQGRRPVVFMTNGFDTRIVDSQYPERKISTIYSKRDLEKLFNLQRMRTSLANVSIDKSIVNRYYQEAAIRAVCESFGKKNRRKALLVMATGSGKTRTVIALVKVLLEHGWIRNILFLADRNSLVTQAKRSFVNLLPDLSVTNLCEEKDNFAAHGVFSTYQTMMNCIDVVRDEEGKLFSCGHFDLLICDEAHRSIYNKYRDIFNYFDAPLIGLTATPKDEIDKNTYSVFELESGVPTYGYELAQAVKDGFLVDFLSVETKLKFLTEGIVYDDLSEEVCQNGLNRRLSTSGFLTRILSARFFPFSWQMAFALILGRDLGRRFFLQETISMRRRFWRFLIKNIRILSILRR